LAIGSSTGGTHLPAAITPVPGITDNPKQVVCPALGGGSGISSEAHGLSILSARRCGAFMIGGIRK
jgi:hypothetical protein